MILNNMQSNDNKKVDVAVIMACGIGDRLSPITFDTPKSMIKINDETLIERQIKQIKQVGIDEIILVVGYLNDKFEFLKNKYNIKIIKNDKFKTTNTLWTLKIVLPYIENKNIYISPSDIYMKDNIYKLYETNTNFKGKFFAGSTNEWGFDLDEKDNIIKINKTSNDSYAMVGIAYFDKNDTNLLCKLTDELLKDEKADEYYWEEIMVKYIDHFNNYKLEKIDKDIIYEFDNLNEYLSFDGLSDDTGCYSFQLISKIFDIKQKQIQIIDFAKTGITNRSYVFKINDSKYKKKYIMRVPGLNTDKFIDRRIEKEALEKLEKYNITEKIIYFDEKTGYKVSEFLEDSRCLDPNSKEDIELAMSEIKKLHSIGKNIIIEKNKNIFDFIDCHTRLIDENNLSYPFNDNDELRKKIDEIILYIKSFDRKIYYCHGDPNPSNMLINKEGIKFIDFEYTMMADPIFEISMFALNCNYDIDKLDMLIDYYKKAPYDNFVLEKLEDAQIKKIVVAYYILSHFYSYLWAINLQYVNSRDYRDVIKYYHTKTNEGIEVFNKL